MPTGPALGVSEYRAHRAKGRGNWVGDCWWYELWEYRLLAPGNGHYEPTCGEGVVGVMVWAVRSVGVWSGTEQDGACIGPGEQEVKGM